MATHGTRWSTGSWTSALHQESPGTLFPQAALPGSSSCPAKGHSVLCGAAHSGGIPSLPQKHDLAQTGLSGSPALRAPLRAAGRLPWSLSVLCPLQATPPSPVIFHIFLGPSSREAEATRTLRMTVQEGPANRHLACPVDRGQQAQRCKTFVQGHLGRWGRTSQGSGLSSSH